MRKLARTKGAFDRRPYCLSKKVAEYSKGIRELYMDKVKGLISESDYADMSRGFSTERDRLERVIADGEKQLAELDEKLRRATIAAN